MSIIKNTISSLWYVLPSDIEEHVTHCFNILYNDKHLQNPTPIFFRADDIAVPSQSFFRMIDLFCKYEVPLALAVVPTWLTENRFEKLKSVTDKKPHLWCWHQHGWRHQNHEKQNKKSEFGESRHTSDIRQDIKHGCERLNRILKNDFTKIFTPPWNRCSGRTLTILSEIGFKAISRSETNLPITESDLPDIYVNIDLHTIKESKSKAAWNQFFKILDQAIKNNYCGFMIHHQRMNDNAFIFLEILLKCIIKHKLLNILHFNEIIL